MSFQHYSVHAVVHVMESGPLQIRWKLLKLNDNDDNADNNCIPTSKFYQKQNINWSGLTNRSLVDNTYFVCQCLACIYVCKRSFWSECVSVWPRLKW